MSNTELAQSIRHKLFAERDTLKEAYEYAFNIFRGLGSGEMAATTAFMVVMNTLANEIEKLETRNG
jgi:hypothetical protein